VIDPRDHFETKADFYCICGEPVAIDVRYESALEPIAFSATTNFVPSPVLKVDFTCSRRGTPDVVGTSSGVRRVNRKLREEEELYWREHQDRVRKLKEAERVEQVGHLSLLLDELNGCP